MADKTISELTAASSIGDNDLFVLQQSNTAKKLTGKTLANYIYQAAGYTKAQIEELLAEMPQLEQYTQEIINAYGAPRVASTKASMTDHSFIYVYTGSESGMTNGHWYYWNGSAWADGGIYNSTGFDTDTTLSVSGSAADSKTVGDTFAKALVYQHVLYNTDDLNNFYTNGIYRYSTAGGFPANCPIEEASILQVIGGNGTSVLIQMVITFRSVIYIRYKETNAWRSWVRITRQVGQMSSTLDQTNRSSDIETILANDKICVLEQGTYYVSGLTMPDSTTLMGKGDSTKIVLLDGYNNPAIEMGNNCTISNLTILGSTETYVASDPFNYWKNGDVNVDTTGYIQLDLVKPLFPGTYTLTANVTSQKSGSCYIGFSTASPGSGIPSDSIIATVNVAQNSTNEYSITISQTCYRVRLCSSTNINTGSGYSATWSDIKLNNTSIVGRCGIAWRNSLAVSGIINNCRIMNFDHAGIYFADTGTPVDHNVEVTSCFIKNNGIGIYIRRNSEFHIISSSTIKRNYYGILNRGGNNTIANCGLDKNIIGVQYDDDQGSNGGHSILSGCEINHSGPDNDGYGIIIRGTGRILVQACNLYYSKTKLENTNGNVFSGCGYGQIADIDVIGGQCSMLVGCMIRTASEFPINITNNNKIKVVNCFDRNGVEITI